MVRVFLRNLAEYGAPSGKEVGQAVITSMTGGFVFAFDQWGVDSFSVLAGVANTLFYSIVIFMLLLVMGLGRRIYASSVGYQLIYGYWPIGLLGSTLLVFLSLGTIQVMFPGGFYAREISHLRLGLFQYRVKVRDLAKCALFGTFAGVVFIAIIKPFITFDLLFGLAVILLASVIPIDLIIRPLFALYFKPGGEHKEYQRMFAHSPGTALLIASRSLFYGALILVVTSMLLALISGPVLTIVGGIVLTGLSLIVYIWKTKAK